MSDIVLHEGDNRETLRRLIDEGVRVHSVVCDPPYGLISIKKRFGGKNAKPAGFGSDGAFQRAGAGFMGQEWDGNGIERDPEFWRLVWEILLPGGYCLAFSGARTGHWQAVAMEQAGFDMHPMTGWVFGCLDTSTQCLTRRGWLNYTDLGAADEVAQWDSETDTLSWVIPHAVHEYDFDGELVNLKNRHTNQFLTPNHRVYAKVQRHSRHSPPTLYEVIEANTMDQRSSAWRVTLPMAAILPGGDEAVDPDHAYLAGWWMTDAWPHKDANACMFSQSKPETLARLRAALAPYCPSEYVKKGKLSTHRDEHTFYLTGSIADWLRSHFPKRELPWSVLSWSLEARQRLYDGLMDGDGSNADKNTTTGLARHGRIFWSQDQARRDVFVALALSLGHRTYEDAKKGAVYVNIKTSTTELQGRHRAERVPYKGKVWCLTVPTGAFVARRDGRPFITGNSGFPKAHDAAKAIDKVLGVEGSVVPQGNPVKRMIPGAQQHATGDWTKTGEREFQPGEYVPGSPEAEQWEGWKYGAAAMKPALEPIYVGQKPWAAKTGARNLLEYGVGALNIDGCRVGDRGARNNGRKAGSNGIYGHIGATTPVDYGKGRHPANLCHDGSDEVRALFGDSKGQIARTSSSSSRKTQNCYGEMRRGAPGSEQDPRQETDTSAARFFNAFPVEPEALYYHAKASAKDRVTQCTSCGQHAAGGKPDCDCEDRKLRGHPTVKPIGLMRHLVRLVTPPGGTVLDPFAGTGTTGAAARAEGFDCILMEAQPEYCGDIRARLNLPQPAALDPAIDDLLGETPMEDPVAELVG